MEVLTGNPKLVTKLVSEGISPDESGLEGFNRAWAILEIELGKFMNANNDVLAGEKGRIKRQRLNAGNFDLDKVSTRGYPYEEATIIWGQCSVGTSSEGLHVFLGQDHLLFQPVEDRGQLILNSDTEFSIEYPFSEVGKKIEGGPLRAQRILGRIYRGETSEGILVDNDDPVAINNYRLASLFHEQVIKRSASEIERRNHYLKTTLLGRLSLRLGLRELSTYTNGYPEPKLPEKVILDYRVVSPQLVKISTLLNKATGALRELHENLL